MAKPGLGTWQPTETRDLGRRHSLLTRLHCWCLQVRIEQAENRLDLALVADLKYGALQEVDEQIRRCVLHPVDTAMSYNSHVSFLFDHMPSQVPPAAALMSSHSLACLARTVMAENSSVTASVVCQQAGAPAAIGPHADRGGDTRGDCQGALYTLPGSGHAPYG